MTPTLFKREKHVAITAPGTGHDLLQQQLKRLGVERRLALSLPTLPGLGNLLAQSDLVATVPERVAQMLVSIAAVRLLAPPFELPAFAIKQHWHERFHLDPANRWLRSMIAEMFLE
jgi:DNA-binding transcriptional LysR family regulator